MTDEYQIDGKTWAEKDASGNISANVDSVNTATIVDSDDGETYDVGDDLADAGGAFTDGDDDGLYTLPSDNDGIDVGSVNTGKAIIADRPMVSTADKTITVDPDGKGWGEAMSEIPLLVKHSITIDPSPADYTGETFQLPPVMVDEPSGSVVIDGDRNTPSNVKVRGGAVAGAYGKRVQIQGLQFEGSGPATDGPSSLEVEEGTVVLQDCNFNNSEGTASRVLTVYGGRVLQKGSIDVGDGVYDKLAVVKNFGSYIESGDGDITGTVNNRVYESQSAEAFYVNAQTSVTSPGARVVTIRTPVYEWDSSSNSVVGVYTDNDQKHPVGDRQPDGYTDVTDSRSFGTWYQNTGNSAIDLAVTAQADADGTNVSIQYHDNDSQSDRRVHFDSDTIDTFETISLTARVGPGRYYKIATGGDTADYSLFSWYEQ